jgi:hypothetical protein
VAIISIYLMTFDNPGGEPVYYVGGTCNLPQRKEQHLTSMIAGKHPNRKVRAAYAAFGVPAFTVLAARAVGSNMEAATVENEWIAIYREKSPWSLCNQCWAVADSYAIIEDKDIVWTTKE